MSEHRIYLQNDIFVKTGYYPFSYELQKLEPPPKTKLPSPVRLE